jgi:hypothetical protein
MLREESKNPDYRLADYFDYVAGTSTGAIIAVLRRLTGIFNLYFAVPRRIQYPRLSMRIPLYSGARMKKPLRSYASNRVARRPGLRIVAMGDLIDIVLMLEKSIATGLLSLAAIIWSVLITCSSLR